MKFSRRDMLKGSGLALGGGLALASSAGSALAAPSRVRHTNIMIPIEHPPEPGTMRITFCGTWYTPRPNQANNSVFVEVGNGDPDDPTDYGDSFVFDCGSGVTAKYTALGVPYSRMQKIFLTHLHGDHMTDLTTIYCFGPAADRKTPLHVWGPSGDTKNEGTWYFCKLLYDMCKWHRESFSFLPTGYAGQKQDGYDLIAHELPYMNNPGIAYNDRGVKISHFPAIHARNGGISYRLEWNGFSMVFTGDTKPNTYVLENAQNVDVLIHEMTTHRDVWTTRETGLTEQDGKKYLEVLAINTEVIANSHTEQTAFGYVMSKTKPRLAVATHYPNDDDLPDQALDDIRCFYDANDDNMLFAEDLRVINLEKVGGETQITTAWAQAAKYPWYHTFPLAAPLGTSKYDGPLAQFNQELIDHIIRADEYAQPGPLCPNK